MGSGAISWPQVQDGELMLNTDFEQMGNAMRTAVGNSLAAILGVPTAIPMTNAFTVTAMGGMAVKAGGDGTQSLYLDSTTGPRYVDSVHAQTFTIAASTSQPRNDLLCALYTQSLPANGTRPYETTAGVGSTINIFNEIEDVTYAVVAGTPSATPVDPSPATGYVAIARIVVPASATSILQSNITILPPTMQQQILSSIAGYVDVTTVQTVGGTKLFTNPIALGTPGTFSGGLYTANTSTVAGATRRTFVGTSGTQIRGVVGNGMTFSDDGIAGGGQFLTVDYTGNLGVKGNASVGGLAATSGAIAGDLTATGRIAAGPLITNAISGDLSANRGNGSGVVFLGDSAHYLYYDANGNYQLPNGAFYVPNGPAYAINFQTMNRGTSTSAALVFGNAISASSQTQVGSGGNSVSGVANDVYGVAIVGVQWLTALDRLGNFGVAGGLFAGGNVGGVNGRFSGYLTVGSLALVPGMQGDLAIARTNTPQAGYIYLGNLGQYFGWDGSKFVFNGTGLPSSNVAYAASNTSYSGPSLSGNILFRKRFVSGRFYSGGALSSGSDPSFVFMPSYLGSFSHSTVFTGAQAVQMEFIVSVKSGAGAQTIGGGFLSNANQSYVNIDGATIFTASRSSSVNSWATTLSEGAHTVIFHFDYGDSDRLFVEQSSWLPISASGGIDGTKFSVAGPT